MAHAAPFAPPRLAARHVRLISGLAIAALLAGNIAPLLLPVDGASPLFMALQLAGWLLSTLVAVGSPGWRIVVRGELDERERADRARALGISHRLTGSALCVAFIWLYAAQTRSLWLPGATGAYWLAATLFWFHVMLPAVILAWRTPVDEED